MVYRVIGFQDFFIGHYLQIKSFNSRYPKGNCFYMYLEFISDLLYIKIAQNGSLALGTVLLIRYGKVGCIHKYPMMV
jgi:hypothetical protein